MWGFNIFLRENCLNPFRSAEIRGRSVLATPEVRRLKSAIISLLAVGPDGRSSQDEEESPNSAEQCAG